MSIEVSSSITDPLGWIHEDYGVWNLISDYADEEMYGYLDNIYYYLINGNMYDKEIVEGKTKEELQEEYNEKFPLMLADVFENIAKDIREGELVIKTEFE